MASYKQRQRQRSIDIATINTNIDDFVIPPREEYRSPYISDETTSTALETSKVRLYLTTLICVLVVIGLLSLAGFIIGIIALVLNINKTGTTAAITSATTVTVTSPVVCTATPTTTYNYSTVSPSQCSNYIENADGTRNIGYTATINSCDNVASFNSAEPVWFRFQDPAGKVIANSPVPPNSCGTVATGWYAGQYPVPNFSTATSIVCYYISTNTCTACNLISVTNCQTFYVFLLPQPPSCNYRYCTL